MAGGVHNPNYAHSVSSLAAESQHSHHTDQNSDAASDRSVPVFPVANHSGASSVAGFNPAQTARRATSVSSRASSRTAVSGAEGSGADAAHGNEVAQLRDLVRGLQEENRDLRTQLQAGAREPQDPHARRMDREEARMQRQEEFEQRKADHEDRMMAIKEREMEQKIAHAERQNELNEAHQAAQLAVSAKRQANSLISHGL